MVEDWRLCNVALESGVVLEEWSSVVTVSVQKDKRERTKCKN